MASSGAQETAQPSVALLGVGLMGRKMAARLRELHFPVTLWNRTKSKAELLADSGCTIANTAAEAVIRADVVILMLADAAAIESTLLKDAAVRAALRGKTVVQMGTIGPQVGPAWFGPPFQSPSGEPDCPAQESKDLCHKITEAGAEYLESPVLGSQPEASKGTLLLMVGANGDPVKSRAWPVLLAFGKEPTVMGEVGSGAATKLAMNQVRVCWASSQTQTQTCAPPLWT